MLAVSEFKFKKSSAYQNSVVVDDGLQSMGDCENGAVLKVRPYGLLDKKISAERDEEQKLFIFL